MARDNLATMNGFDDTIHDELVERADALRPLLERNAVAHEERGELAPEVVTALKSSGLFAMPVPRRWGGLAVSTRTMTDVTALLARACPSTAWVVSIITNSVWSASTLADPVQRRIFRDGVPLVCAPQNGLGKVEQKGGGYVVTGRWSYGSGSHHSDWALAPCMIGEARCLVALPMPNLSIERTWNVAGMKGTGSDTVVAEAVLIDADQLHMMPPSGEKGPSEFECEASDWWAMMPLLRTKALSVLLGTAEGLLDAVKATSAKPIIYSAFEQRQSSATWIAGLGEAAAAITSARSLLLAQNDAIDGIALRGQVPSYADRAGFRGGGAVMTDLLNRAVDRLMNLAGSSSFLSSSPIQRFWRDYSVGARHVVFNAELGYEVFGRWTLGMEPAVVLPDFV